jgi:hypothetical protein
MVSNLRSSGKSYILMRVVEMQLIHMLCYVASHEESTGGLYF